MPAEFLAVGAELLSWSATYLLHSTCLLGGVWLLVRLRPTTGPMVREALWKTALVGGLITTPAQLLLNVPAPLDALTLTLPMGGDSPIRPDYPSLQNVANVIDAEPSRSESTDSHYGGLVLGNDVSLSPDLEWEMERARLLDLEMARASLDVEAPPTTPNVQRAPVSAIAEEPVVTPTPSGPVVPRSPRATLLIALLTIGACSFGVGLGRYAWQSVALRRRLAGAQEIHAGPTRDLLDELCRTIPRSPAVRLLSAPCCTEPAAFGLRRWTIVLPAKAERDLSADEMRSLLAHELAHLARGDMWWLLVSRLVCSCGGFQPLNHLARREWQRAAEYLCDAWAVSRTGNRLALARCLTEVASWRLSETDCAASLAATGSRSTLADRIERLVDGRPIAELPDATRTRRRLMAAAIVVLAGLIGSGMRVNLSIAAPLASSPATATDSSTDGAAPSTIDAGSSRKRGFPANAASTSANALQATDSGQPATAVEATPATVDASQTRRLYEALDDELRSLQHDLTELQPLLKQPHIPAEAARLAELLQRESVKLEERRAALNRSMSRPGERGASAP